MVIMSNVWDRATEFLSDNLAAVIPIAVLAIFLPGSIQANLAPLAKSTPSLAVAVQLVGIVAAVASLWGQLAIIALAIDPAAGRGPAVQIANRRLLPAIGISLLLLLLVVLLLIPVGASLGVAGYDFQAAMQGADQEMPVGAGVFIFFYILLLVPVLIWLGARLTLVNPVVVFERRGVGALRRSFVLTRGITWKIIGVVLLFGIVAGVAILAAQTVFGSILQLIAGGEGDISVATVLTSVLVGTVGTAFTVLAAAFVAKLYLAVRDARESIVESA